MYQKMLSLVKCYNCNIVTWCMIIIMIIKILYSQILVNSYVMILYINTTNNKYKLYINIYITKKSTHRFLLNKTIILLQLHTVLRIQYLWLLFTLCFMLWAWKQNKTMLSLPPKWRIIFEVLESKCFLFGQKNILHFFFKLKKTKQVCIV